MPGAQDGTLARLLQRAVARNEDKPAVIHETGRLSYRELWAHSGRAARALIARGGRPGDRLGSWSPNVVESVIIQCAALRIGAVTFHLDPEWSAEEAREVLDHAAIGCVFLRAYHEGRQYPAMIKSIHARLAKLRHVIAHGRQPRFERVLPGGWLDFLESGDGVAEAVLSDREAEASAWLAGDRWLVALPDARGPRRVVALGAVEIFRAARRVGVAGPICLATPLHRPAGLIGCLAALLGAGAIVLPPLAADAASVLAFAREHRCTRLLMAGDAAAADQEEAFGVATDVIDAGANGMPGEFPSAVPDDPDAPHTQADRGPDDARDSLLPAPRG